MPAIDVAPFVHEGLSLRPWQPTDLDALAALVTDAEVMARVGGALRRDEVAGLLDRYLRDDDPRVLVALCVRDATGTHLGSGQLVRSTLVEDAVELGYLVRRDQHGRGHATRIARALVALARAHFPAARLVATVDVDHSASIRVLEKAGLQLAERAQDEEGDYLVYEPR